MASSGVVSNKQYLLQGDFEWCDLWEFGWGDLWEFGWDFRVGWYSGVIFGSLACDLWEFGWGSFEWGGFPA